MLTQKTFVKSKASTRTSERLSAFLVPQEGGFITTIRRLDVEMINDVGKDSLSQYFPGNAIAAASYILRPVDWQRELQADSDNWIMISPFTNYTLQGDEQIIKNPFFNFE